MVSRCARIRPRLQCKGQGRMAPRLVHPISVFSACCRIIVPRKRPGHTCRSARTKDDHRDEGHDRLSVVPAGRSLCGAGATDERASDFRSGGQRVRTSICDRVCRPGRRQLYDGRHSACAISRRPALLPADPARGGVWSRTVYAATRILVTKTDSGGTTFNFSEVVGNSISAAVGNAYYPGETHLSDNLGRLGTYLATDAISQVLKEFWPDIKRKYLSHHHKDSFLLPVSSTAGL